MHEMTVRSKAIVEAFYSRGPQLSYYQGCSTGGRQGMMEAQRYPEDFDAIIAGAPVYNQVHLNVSQTALQVEMLKNPARLVPANKVTLYANAVMAACDAQRRRQGQHHQQPAAVQVRSRDAALQRGRRRRLPHRAAGRIREAAVLAGEIEIRRGGLSGPCARRRSRLGGADSDSRRPDESALGRHAAVCRPSGCELGCHVVRSR